ncbi:hypothetical protein Micbo1qcDRAFT_26551 [Microdochium bolleyi]|uniref:WIBG Mago-binding domain-containing protein n=1 Tax=Microdochium bolleyi TaxID=196109 RepID=A0A136JE88_9PEZI|nr:hypothetical protein Micbo1qcDRAFT_26551 [Microdochium bolleyi]
MPSEPTKSGIVTDEASGDRQIPESVRADGSTRKAIKIRPGYRPPEDVELYKNRTAEGFRNRGKTGGGVIGAEGLKKTQPVETPAASAASNKNAKRREARKKAKDSDQSSSTAPGADSKPAQEEEADPEVEKERKARNLRKKLKQARELKNKKEGGEALLPEQIAKVIKINELVRELAALGFTEEEPTASTDKTTDKPQDG